MVLREVAARPEQFVDIDGYIERKIAALHCHDAQMVLTIADMQHHLRASGLDVPWLAELDPHDYHSTIDRRMRAAGRAVARQAEMSCEYAEGFRRTRFGGIESLATRSGNNGGRLVKLGCSSWSYHAAFRAGNLDLREWLRVCAEDLEVDGVELVDLHFPTSDPLYLRDLKKLCTDLQLTISGIAVSNDFGADERRADEIEKVQQLVRHRRLHRRAHRARVRRLGAATARRAGPGPHRRHTAPGARAEAGQHAPYLVGRGLGDAPVRGLRRRTRRRPGAAEQQLGRASSRTIRQIEQCLHDVGSPWLARLPRSGRLRRRAGLRRDRCRASSRLTPACATSRTMAATTRVHWPELLRQLQLARYRGFVHVDYEGVEDPDFGGAARGALPARAAAAAEQAAAARRSGDVRQRRAMSSLERHEERAASDTGRPALTNPRGHL